MEPIKSFILQAVLGRDQLQRKVIYELAYTVDVSAHGARVLTKNPWPSNQHLTVRSVQGNLYSHARVAYCQSIDGRSFAIGVQLRQPAVDWTEPQKHST